MSKSNIEVGQIINLGSSADDDIQSIKVVDFDRYRVDFKIRKGNSGRFSRDTHTWSRAKLSMRRSSP